MQLDAFKNYCLTKKGVIEEQPLGNDSYYYKVKGLIFAIVDAGECYRITLKCEPTKAVSLREQFGFVKPGYHINKEHWNTILMEEANTAYPFEEHINEAYQLVLQKLNKKQRAELGIEAA